MIRSKEPSSNGNFSWMLCSLQVIFEFEFDLLLLFISSFEKSRQVTSWPRVVSFSAKLELPHPSSKMLELGIIFSLRTALNWLGGASHQNHSQTFCLYLSSQKLHSWQLTFRAMIQKYYECQRIQRQFQFKFQLCVKFIIKMEEESFVLIRSYKTDEPIQSIEEFPLPASERIPTDRFCTYVSAIFALAMLVGALVSYDGGKLQRMTYPTDQQGRHCTLDNSHFNYLYFTSANDPSKRLCLSQCPTGNEEKLNCWPTQNLSCAKNSNTGFQVSIYPSQPSDTSLGLFCEAKDPALNKKLLENANLAGMYDFVSAYYSIGLAFLISIAVGIVGVLGFSYLPGVMAYTSIIIGGIGSIVFAIYLLASESGVASAYRGLVIIFAVIIGFVGALLIYSSIWRQKDIKISIVYLQQASNCLKEFPLLIFISPIFVLLLILLVVLVGFQTLAYWSQAELYFEPNSVYTYPWGGVAIMMTVLNFLEFIWGLSFLKEAFNMVVSGSAVSWYFRKQHSLSFALGNLFRFHWGSVVASAFLLHLLYPFDLLYDIFKPQPNSRGVFKQICCCCEQVLDLVRSESMVLVNIAALPYCNASRWCEKVLYHSESTEGSQSSNRFVRMGAHMILALIGTLTAYLKMSGAVSVLALMLTFVLNIFAVTFFVCLLQDISETLYFSLMLEEYYSNAKTDSLTKKLFPEGYQVFPTEG